MTMRQKIESLTMFDTELILGSGDDDYDDDDIRASKESLRRSFQQSISAAVLVSLAHKRYERRRLAAMEIEKVVRSLVQQQHQNQGELERVRAILLLLSDDYVRSTNEDARKGGVVALAACAIGLKKSNDMNPAVMECKDLILASVVHACQDHSQRVRYYATESLFNVVKVIPTLAVQHFFILFEILRSLYADVDLDVRSGAELLDKKLKEVIVGAINSGSFTADACIPLFARYLYLRNKATKRLTLTWLHDFSKKLIGAPILEFLHLFLGGIFAMVADPNASIRQSALDFLQSVLPKLLVHNEDFEDPGTTMKVDFDKILQSLVTTMEHPDPFVRKVAMSWMCRIVKAHMGEEAISDKEKTERSNTGDMDGDTKTLTVVEDKSGKKAKGSTSAQYLSAASISVRNSVPHVLPGILLR
jgi:vacuole morphology and inheritance protein 14